MGNLKYNPLLKLNLQEETSAEEIIGDGYNEKLLTWNDFLNDCQTITEDTGEIRKYILTKTEYGPSTQINCYFSFELFANGNSIHTYPKPNLLGRKIILHNLNFYNSTAHQPFNFKGCEVVFIIGTTYFSFPTGLLIQNDTKPCSFFILNTQFWVMGDYTYNPTYTKNFYFLDCVNSAVGSGIHFSYPQKFSIFCNNEISKLFLDRNFKNYFGIDSALDLNSRGLLPNSVITAALNDLQPDSSLDANSNKPVMNSAVTTEINQIMPIVENYQDINVSNLTEFENAIQTGQSANVRIHLTTDITLTQSVTYNLDKIQIYGHDNKINLENYTFTIHGETCYFNQMRFNANSSVNANTAANYSNAQINIISTANSTRYFFEYVIFLNFFCKSSDNSNTDYVRTFIDCQNGSGLTHPSLHLYFTYCEIMTNFMQSNINNLCAAVNHSGSLHALTVHMVDFWGNNQEDNSCPNWTFTGNTLSGLAKLGWISDGSAIYAPRTNSLSPSFVNQYNPSTEQFTSLQNKLDNIFALQHRTVSNSGSYTGGTFTASADIYFNSAFAFVYYNITTTASSTQPENIVFLDLGLTLSNSFYQVVANPPTEQDFKILVWVNGKIYNVYGVPYIPYEGRGQFFVNLVQS